MNEDGPITLSELLILIGLSLIFLADIVPLMNLLSFLLSLKLFRISKYLSEASEEFKSKLSSETSLTGLYLSVAFVVLSIVMNSSLLVLTESKKLKLTEFFTKPLFVWELNWLKFDFGSTESLWMNGRTSLLRELSLLTLERKSETGIRLRLVWNPLFGWIVMLDMKSFAGSMHYKINVTLWS